MIRISFLIVAVAILGCTPESDPGCSKDSECKGSRVCSDGECVGGATTTKPVQTTTPTTEPTGCDLQGDCTNCYLCAYDNDCALQYDACSMSQDCSGLVSCLADCTDQTCEGACFNAYPDSAAQLLITLYTCADCTCPNDCATCQ